MSRDISYRSPQQIPQSKKPNLENIPPQRNTFEYIKNMKKRQCDTPYSGISHNQDSQIQEARSIIIDISRIEQKSYYDQSLKGIQPSNCSTQRTNRYEIQRQSPYIEQQSFASMYYMQQQMLQLQNENLELKQRLQQQENQRIMLQQITELKSQQQQQPIVINNNIMAQDKQNDCTIPIPMRDQSHSIEKYKSPSIRELHQRENSKQIQSYTNASVQFASPKICQQTQTIETEKSVTILPNRLIDRCIRTDVDVSQTNQDNIRPQYNILNAQSCKQLGETETSFNQSNPYISCNQSNQNSLNQVNQTNINNQSNLIYKDNQQDQIQTNNIPNQSSAINQTIQNSKQNDANNQYSYTSQFRPSERLEVIFDEDDNNNTYDPNQTKKLSLADCFQQRKKPQDRKVSAPIPEEVNWIVNVKQRSKEDQMKLRKEMMSYGRSRKNTAATKSVMEEQCSSVQQRMQSPLMERLATGQKAKVEPKEMYALTRKNYENLPEVRSRKEQEEKKQKLLNFNKERQNKLKELDEVQNKGQGKNQCQTKQVIQQIIFYMKTQSNTKNIFQTQNPQYPLKQLYADSLERQMRDQELRKLEFKRQEQQMEQKQVVQQTYDSPFGKDRIKQLQFINSQLAKPIYNVEDFVQKQNFEEMLRPKTRFTTRQNTQNNSKDYQDDQKQQQTQHTIELTPTQKYSQPPILTNRSIVHPPKTPGSVYDGNNNPVQSDYVSTYDQQHSHKWKQEKSNEMKELNNINAAYLSNLLKQLQGNKSQQFYPNQYQQPPQSHRGRPLSDQIDLLKQQELDRLREQERQQEYLRQQQLQEQEQQRQQQLAEQKYQEEQKMKQLREQVEKELEVQRRLNQQEDEVQTITEMQNTGTQHVDHNAVTASQYMDSLKQLSGSVIDMKNQFIQEQSKLKYELIQLKDKQIKDIEEKQRVQKELRELEQRHKAFRVWEGEKQNQLMQALANNAPIPNIRSQNIDYSKLNPTLKKVTRFRDQTLGYEYDESNSILSKSNLVPMNYNYDNNRNLHNLRDEAPLLPEELDRAKDDFVPKINYSNQVTKDLRLKDFNDKFYDYKYQKQGEQKQPEYFEQEKYQRNNTNMDPNRVLLENDRRLYELNILDPKSDQDQVQELYSYI